jgi:hypothetical protein
MRGRRSNPAAFFLCFGSGQEPKKPPEGGNLDKKSRPEADIWIKKTARRRFLEVGDVAPSLR